MTRRWTVVLLTAALVPWGIAGAQEEPQEPEEPQAAEAPAPSSSGMTGNVQFLIGQRYMTDDEFWNPLDTASAFGIEVDFGPARSPIHVALGVTVAGDDGTATALDPYFGQTGGVDSRFFEFSAGFLWHPVRQAIVRPYLGGGTLILTAATSSDWGLFSGDGDSEQSFGFYANAGVFFKVGDSFNIGIDGRIVRGTSTTFAGIDGDADYEQINMLIGFSWGGHASPPAQNGATPR